jgi:hypothetical protein
MEIPMKVVEYTTEISPDGRFTLPPTIMRSMNLTARTQVRVLLLYEEMPPKSLERFGGRWQDTRSADEIVAAIYAERQSNLRTDEVQW